MAQVSVHIPDNILALVDEHVKQVNSMNVGANATRSSFIAGAVSIILFEKLRDEQRAQATINSTSTTASKGV